MEEKWTFAKDIFSSKIDEEYVLMSVKENSYFSIDQVGSAIWEILTREPRTIDEIVQLLMQEYEVDKNACTKDVQEFIGDMAAKHLIHPAK